MFEHNVSGLCSSVKCTLQSSAPPFSLLSALLAGLQQHPGQAPTGRLCAASHLIGARAAIAMGAAATVQAQPSRLCGHTEGEGMGVRWRPACLQAWDGLPPPGIARHAKGGRAYSEPACCCLREGLPA
jgi:hypothetical protein